MTFLLYIDRSIDLVKLHKENKSPVMITNRIFKKRGEKKDQIFVLRFIIRKKRRR